MPISGISAPSSPSSPSSPSLPSALRHSERRQLLTPQSRREHTTITPWQCLSSYERPEVCHRMIGTRAPPRRSCYFTLAVQPIGLARKRPPRDSSRATQGRYTWRITPWRITVSTPKAALSRGVFCPVRPGRVVSASSSVWRMPGMGPLS